MKFIFGFLFAVSLMSSGLLYGVGNKMIIISFNGFQPLKSIDEQPSTVSYINVEKKEYSTDDILAEMNHPKYTR